MTERSGAQHNMAVSEIIRRNASVYIELHGSISGHAPSRHSAHNSKLLLFCFHCPTFICVQLMVWTSGPLNTMEYICGVMPSPFCSTSLQEGFQSCHHGPNQFPGGFQLGVRGLPMAGRFAAVELMCRWAFGEPRHSKSRV